MSASASRITTGMARLSYCHLTTPRAADQNAEPKYSVTILIPKTDVATKYAIDTAIQTAIQEGIADPKTWNGRRPANPTTPLYDGDGVRRNGEAFGAECKGHWVFTASSKDRPKVYDANLQEIFDPTQIYSGMYGRANVRFYAFSKSGNTGIACALNMVQKLQDGEPLSGSRVTAEEAFGQMPAYLQQPAAPSPVPPAPPVQPAYPAPAMQPPAAAYPAAPGMTPAYPAPGTVAPGGGVDPFTGLPL